MIGEAVGSDLFTDNTPDAKTQSMMQDLTGPAPELIPNDSRNHEKQSLAKELANTVVFTLEREMDSAIATSQVARIVKDHIKSTALYPELHDCIDILLANDETKKHAGMVLASFFWNEDDDKSYRGFMESFIDRMLRGHHDAERNPFRDKKSGKLFSAFAFTLGEVFIQLYKISPENYYVISELFTDIVRKETKSEIYEQQRNSHPFKSKPKIATSAVTKKLFDDMFDYINQRSSFSSNNLNTTNPFEYIIALSDRLRSTRRYVIQDVINKNAVERKKAMEKALKERQASAEEIISMFKPFAHGLKMFHSAKLYNIKYVEIEKKRITMQILPIFIATAVLAGAFLELVSISMTSMITIGIFCLCMRFFVNEKTLSHWYPKDQTAQLELDVSEVCRVMRKTSGDQLDSFLRRVVKESKEVQYLRLMPEYTQYIFSVIPHKKDILISQDQLEDTIGRLNAQVTQHSRMIGR